jgi:hypothetical protein
MIEQVSPAVSVLFILTTFAAVGILLQSLKRYGLETAPSRILVFILPLWILFQGIISKSGFYSGSGDRGTLLVLTGILPALAFTLAFVFAFRRSFTAKVDLGFLLLIHIVRIPAEIGLYMLHSEGLVSSDITFAGYNFDIVAGIAALLLFVVYRTTRHISGSVRWIFDVSGILLLFTGILAALLSPAASIERSHIEGNSIGLYYFPIVWLPTVILPIILFAHLASLTQLVRSKDNS